MTPWSSGNSLTTPVVRSALERIAPRRQSSTLAGNPPEARSAPSPSSRSPLSQDHGVFDRVGDGFHERLVLDPFPSDPFLRLPDPCADLLLANLEVDKHARLSELVEVLPRGCEGDRTGSEEAVTVRRIPRRHVAERQRDDLVPVEGADALDGPGDTDLEVGPPHRLLAGGR